MRRNASWMGAAVLATTGLIGTIYGAHAMGSRTQSGASEQTAKLERIQQREQQEAARRNGPRFSPWMLSNPDPALTVNQSPEPRIVYASAPCPAGTSACDREAPPLAGDGKFLTVTNYYLGATFEVFAAGPVSAPGPGFILANGQQFALPINAGVPTLTQVTGGPTGKAFFETSNGHAGYLDMRSGQIVLGS